MTKISGFEIYQKVRRGDGIVVQYGTQGGSQYALVHRRDKTGFVRVLKWSNRSQKWTGEIKLYPGELIRRASLGEYKTTPVKDAAGWQEAKT